MSRRLPLIALLTGGTISAAGTRMSQLAVPWLVLTTTHSAVQTGLVSTAEIAPYVVLQVLGAPLVDRFGGYRIAQLGNSVAAVAMGAIPLVWVAGWRQLGLILALVFIAGLARGPADPAQRVLLPAVTETAGMAIDRAAALFDGTNRVAGLVGVPLAGVLIGTIGAANVVAVDAATFAITVALMLLVPADAGDTGAVDEAGYVAQLKASFSFVRKHPFLRSVAGMVLFTNFADAAMSGLFVLLWVQRHYQGPGRIGLMSITFGLGAVAGTALMVTIGPRLPRRWTYAGTFLIAGSPRFVALALSAPFPVILATWAVSGLAAGAINPLLAAAEYETVPRELQARVLAVVGSLAWAGIPFGALVGGVLVNRTSLTGAIAIVGGMYFLATLDPIVRPAWKSMDRQPVVEPQGEPLLA